MPRPRSSNIRRVLVAWNAVLVGAAVIACVALGGTTATSTEGAMRDPARTAANAVRGLAGSAQPAALPPDVTPPPAAPATTAAPIVAPAPPPPPEPVAAPPPPAPIPPPAPAPEPAPTEDPNWRVQRAFAAGVPEVWRAAVPARLEVVPGTTSWAHGSGTISIATSHASGDFDHLVDVVVHEFGHLIAFRYGSGDYAGAGPAGWPAPAVRPEEAWADCVQTAFTGRQNPSHGLAPCGGEQLSWVADWLAFGPPDAS